MGAYLKRRSGKSPKLQKVTDDQNPLLFKKGTRGKRPRTTTMDEKGLRGKENTT